MQVKKYLDKTSNLITENKLLKFSMVCLSAAVIILSLAQYRAIRYTRTIIIPAKIEKPIIANDDEYNKDGLKMFTRYTFDLFLNSTPESSEGKFTELLKLIHTNYYSEVYNELMEQLETIQRLKVVSVFLIEEIKINPGEKKINVTGIRERESYGKKIDGGVEHWQIQYKIIEANFKITRIKKIEKA